MAGADAFGQPTWADTDPVNLGVDLTRAADAVGHGPYRRGTAAERAAVAPIWDGLTWWQTDGAKGLWRVEGGVWRHLPHIRHGKTGSSTVGGWTNLGPTSPLPEGTPMHLQTGFFRGTTSSTGTLSTTLPTAFPNGAVSVLLQRIRGDNPVVFSISASGFQTLWGSQPNTDVAFFWIAAGY